MFLRGCKEFDATTGDNGLESLNKTGDFISATVFANSPPAIAFMPMLPAERGSCTEQLKKVDVYLQLTSPLV